MALSQRLILIGITYLFWCLLNWLPSHQALIIGIPVSIVVALITEQIPIVKESALLFQPKRHFIFLFQYLPVFWWEHFKSNLDVAYRVLHPRLPICPAVVRIKTELKSDMALTLLANSLSLVPGTTSMDVDPEAGLIYVHCMKVDKNDVEAAARGKIQKFEKILKKIFE